MLLYPVGSCNGLLCLFGRFSKNNQKILFYLWNPATMTRSNKIEFPRKIGFQDRWKFAFGYDNSTDTYKIVAFNLMTNRVCVFNFGDNVWRNIQSFLTVPYDLSFYYHSYLDSNHGVYVSGTLNWLAVQNKLKKKNQIDHQHLTIDQFVIISLNLSTETYLQLLPPWDFDKVPCVLPTLSVLMNSFCFSHDFHKTDFIIWQMKEFGIQESWTQFLKISYNNLCKSLQYDYEFLLFPVCLSENGDTLILAWTWSLGWHDHEQAIIYRLRDKAALKTEIADKIKWFHAKDYVESLVSTNRK
jgi:F-box interacting protein